MKKPRSKPIIRTLLLYLVPFILVVGAILLLKSWGFLGAGSAPTPLPQQGGAPVFRVITPTPTPTAQPSQTKPAQASQTVPAEAASTATVSPPGTAVLPAAATVTATTAKNAAALSEAPHPVDLLKGPDLIYTGKTGEMKLFWQASASTTFRLDYETADGPVSSSQPIEEYDAENHLYAVTLTGLATDTLYTYRLMEQDDPEERASASFRSAPDPSAAALKFISYGDTRSNPDLHNAVAEQVLALIQSDPDYQTFNLFSGDLVVRGDEDQYWSKQLFDQAYPAIQAELSRLPFIVSRGNHEDTGALFARYFPMPFVASYYWSFDYGPAHIAVIDQYDDLSTESAQYAWLKQDLETSTKTWKIALLHAPGWSAGGKHENNKTVQNVLQPLFLQTGVKLVIGGHNHYYARAEVDGITHLTIGTGGATSYQPQAGYPNIVTFWQGTGFCKFEIQGNTLTGAFVDNTGAVQDSFVINK